MTHFKEIIAGIKSCFTLTANERLIIMLLLALFLIGLGLRWRHLSREQADRCEPPARPPASAVPKALRAGNASRALAPRDAGGLNTETNASRK